MTSLDSWLKGRFLHWTKDSCTPKEWNRYGQIIATSDRYWVIEEYFCCDEEWSKYGPRLFTVNEILECDYELFDSIELLGLQPPNIDYLLESEPTIESSAE